MAAAFPDMPLLSGNGQDKFGFSALAGGISIDVEVSPCHDPDILPRYYSGSGFSGRWWSASETIAIDSEDCSVSDAFFLVLGYFEAAQLGTGWGKDLSLYSVRCLKD